MRPSHNASSLLLEFEDADYAIDTEGLDKLTRQVLRELRELPLEVERPEGEPIPPGAKAGAAVALGTLIVSLLPEVIPQLVRFLKSWSSRAQNRRVRIRTEAGDRAVEIEYQPNLTSMEELQEILEKLTATLEEGESQTVDESP